MTTWDDLAETLQGRTRPEDVARMILALRGEAMTDGERAALGRRLTGWSLMENHFAMPITYRSTVNAVRAMTGLPLPGDDSDPAQLRAVAAVAQQAGLSGAMGSHRRRKLARIASRLQEAAERQDRLWELATLARFAKTGLAAELPRPVVLADPDTACFLAYYTAQLGRRSLFTAGPQARPFDAVAELLLARAMASPTPMWHMIAAVFPRSDILAHTTPGDRLWLLGRAIHVMALAADRLRQIAVESGLDRRRMIVQRGQDSSTWNALAGAFNRARDLWIAVIQSLGLDAALDVFCPGKVMRLMAADVALGLHGGAAHGDEAVWAALPAPWEVLAGPAALGRNQIAAVCAQHGVDPARSGWAAARPRTTVAPVTFTPETVHGVAVGDPLLAAALRRAGVMRGSPER